ncbi:alpha/beta fold hydrolase [Streptomyces syringium]|uniref:Pimeloyl-ACP methyl ester carboxylesterase n=1 Tax=Streptomyces syringium TaxID=76729 RepID=A0ABS4XXC8_9ACTN|nr:alpha/beta fold hydrolase [Streptomyces syringium]MBP2401168.1 pimeloyl-ACP methyl ester carboxylesterase [Streptomyces syringium]
MNELRTDRRTDAIRDFQSQSLLWSPADEEALNGLECAELAVPLDYADPGGRALTLGLVRSLATSSERRRGVLLVGPGDDLGNRGTLLGAQLVRTLPKEVLAQYDVVAFDHRFMGRSSPVVCGLEPEERLWVFHQPRDFAHEVRFQAEVAAKVAEHALDILPYANSRNIARDMEVIRGALGEERLSYLGYSYGTYLGAVWTQMFGEHADRVVLDSICSPDWVWRGLFTDFPPNGERALSRWTRWAARRDAELRLGRTPGEVRAAYDRLLARADGGADVSVAGFPLDRTLVRLVVVGMLNSDLNYDHLGDVLRSAVHGAALEPPTLAFLAGMFGQPKEESGTVAQLAILAGDWAWPRRLGPYERDMNQAARRYPFTGAALSGIKATAFWPVPPSEPVTPLGPGNRAGSILLVQSAEDMSTPHAAAVRMREVLRHNSRLVTVADTAHHRVFPFYGNPGADELVTTYLTDGALPAADVICPNPQPQI